MRVEFAAGVALAAILLAVVLLRHYARLPGWPLLVLVVALVLALVRGWSDRSTGADPDHLVRASLSPAGGGSKTLIVLVHGLGGPAALREVRADLAKFQAEDWTLLDSRPPEGGAERAPEKGPADVLVVDYGDTLRVLPSNTRAADVARGVSRRIQEAVDRGSYDRIVVVGYSMGATVARGAFLDASNRAVGSRKTTPPEPPGPAEPKEWVKKVCRFVLLAGMNRGWDFSGLKPSDMAPVKYGVFRAGADAGRWTKTGQLYLDTEAGSEFVANVRLEWMRLAREREADMPGTVQLLGDIDDFVSDADNKDLRVAGASQFAWLRVRGTGHAEIVQFGRREGADPDERRLGDYRAGKVRQAVARPFAELRAAAEEQPYQDDRDVARVVFVVHGIRDLGQWSSGFEADLQAAFRRRQAAGAAAAQVGLAAGLPVPGPKVGALPAGAGAPAKLVVVTPRYGYLPMGPFLLHPVREKYVRGLMDVYTETLARYPAARTVDAIGHSNGTYLITGALQDYRAVKLDRVVLGNAVVRGDYPWAELRAAGRVTAVRNYVTSDDRVVALFPRFFEQPPGGWLGNNLGGAGFTGFGTGTAGGVTNVATVRGGHSALHDAAEEKRRDDIVAFVLDGRADTTERLWGRLPDHDWLSANCYLVWGALAYLLVLVGYCVLLISAGSWLRLTGREWTWLAAGCWWWVVGTLRLLGALLCLLTILAYFFTARESLLFVLVVALLSGWVMRRLFPSALGPAVAVPPALTPLEVMPAVLAGGLGVSFVAGGLAGLGGLGWLLLAALAVVPVVVLSGLAVALVLPAPGPRLRLAARITVAVIAVTLAAADWREFGLLVGVFVLGWELVWLVGGPLNDAAKLAAGVKKEKPPKGVAALLHALFVLLAPAYFAVVGYMLLIY